jgi:guanylate kinase
MLVILSGVAGAGKDTIKKEIIKRMDNVKSIPSFTSRAPREGDVPGQTYIFLSKEEFEEKIRNNEVYEYDIHHNNYYGTSKKILNEESKNGIIIKDIDVNRNRNLKKYFKRYQNSYNIFKSSKRRITS